MKMKQSGIKTLAYADDEVFRCSNTLQIHTSIQIMKEWWCNNRIKLNIEKSGILRILFKRGKCPGFPNILNIPEVSKYTYLRIQINQALKLKDHEEKIKAIEHSLLKKASILMNIIKSTKGKRILFKVLLRSKWSYGISALIEHSPKYEEKWRSTLYRLIKRLFHINCNASKNILFKTLLLNPDDMKNAHSKYIDRLSKNAIKLRLGWLFNKYNKEKLFCWGVVASNEHFIDKCVKTD